MVLKSFLLGIFVGGDNLWSLLPFIATWGIFSTTWLSFPATWESGLVIFGSVSTTCWVGATTLGSFKLFLFTWRSSELSINTVWTTSETWISLLLTCSSFTLRSWATCWSGLLTWRSTSVACKSLISLAEWFGPWGLICVSVCARSAVMQIFGMAESVDWK